MHSAISGTVDYHEASDEACITRIRSLVDKMGARQRAPFDAAETEEPVHAAEEVRYLPVRSGKAV